MSNAAQLKERDVLKQVKDFMELRGWRGIRNSVGAAQSLVTGRYVPFGEPGMADLLFVRYQRRKPPWAMLVWIETKRGKGGRLSERQIAWQEKERAQGAVVINVDNFENYAVWYNEKLGWLHTGAGPDVPGNLDLFAESPRKDTS